MPTDEKPTEKQTTTSIAARCRELCRELGWDDVPVAILAVGEAIVEKLERIAVAIDAGTGGGMRR